MLSAGGVWNAHGFRYAGDNGAWKAWREFNAGVRATPEPDLARFQAFVQRVGAGADFLVVPDIVAGGTRSWALSRYWLRELRRDWRLRDVKLLIAVQDKMTPELVRPYISERVGIFVGGSTEWKLGTLGLWAAMAHSRGAWCHVGRVNTAKRIRVCEENGVSSWDGASAALFPKTLAFLDRERHRQSLLGKLARTAATMSPEEFARRCGEIANCKNHQTGAREYVRLCEQALVTTGYGHGVQIFRAAILDIAGWRY